MFLGFEGGFIMKGSHLTLDDRKKIQEGIEQALTKVQIGKKHWKRPNYY